MGQPRISVVMCTCNGARYLDVQLQSIAGQTVLPDELVICDDVSDDETVAICDDFAGKVPFPVRVTVNLARLGPAKNFENAMQLAEGEYLMLCDQDDVWNPEKIQVLVGALLGHPEAGYAFSDAIIINADGCPAGHTLWALLGFKDQLARFSDIGQLEVLLKRNFINGAAMAVRASLRNQALPIAPGWMHDYWIALLGSALSYGVPVPEPLFSYRQHRGQLCSCLPPPSDRGLKWRRQTLARVLRSSVETGSGECKKKLLQFQQFLHKLDLAAQSGPYDCRGDRRELLRQKELHLLNRAKSRSISGPARLFTVLGEACTGRYQRFSGSWLSIFRDLWLPM
jgi:hypothetical protein